MIPLLFFVIFTYPLDAVTASQGICETSSENIWVNSWVIIHQSGFKTALAQWPWTSACFDFSVERSTAMLVLFASLQIVHSTCACRSLKAMGPRFICFNQCYSAADSATVQSPCPTGEPLLHTANIPMSAQVQRGCTDFQVWNKLESCVLVWSLQCY